MNMDLELKPIADNDICSHLKEKKKKMEIYSQREQMNLLHLSVSTRGVIAVNFAGCISLYGPLNLKVVRNPFPRARLT